MTTDHLSTIFGALADPKRRAILTRLASDEWLVGELAKSREPSVPAVSKHLEAPQRARLITLGRQAQ